MSDRIVRVEIECQCNTCRGCGCASLKSVPLADPRIECLIALGEAYAAQQAAIDAWHDRTDDDLDGRLWGAWCRADEQAAAALAELRKLEAA